MKYAAVKKKYYRFLLAEKLGDIYLNSLWCFDQELFNKELCRFVPTCPMAYTNVSLAILSFLFAIDFISWISYVFIILQSDGPIDDAVHERMLVH